VADLVYSDGIETVIALVGYRVLRLAETGFVR
jgi:hypothetical protein